MLLFNMFNFKAHRFVSLKNWKQRMPMPSTVPPRKDIMEKMN